MLAAFLCSSALSGCVAVSNPVANGIPVRRLPPELFTDTKEDQVTIPLSLLRQKPPDVYRLGAGDVLGIWVEGVLGERTQLPPVHFPESADLQPAMGFPIPVREDGTIALPLVPAIKVEGMTERQAEEAVRQEYTVKQQILQPGRDRIIVSVIRRRQYRVLVVREEAGQGAPAGTGYQAGRSVSFNLGGGSQYGVTGRSQGFAIDLAAYENDLMNALARTGGLPGFESSNEVLIERASSRPDAKDLLDDPANRLTPGHPLSAAALAGQITRIPLRLRQGEPPPFKPEDILLNTGDIVYVQARGPEVFYTGGLLPPGEFMLPRDYDLDVVEVVARVGGALVSNLNANNISGQVTSIGLGSPNPSLLTVVRRTPGGGQVLIKVDLNRAVREPDERLLIQAGDVLILQETPSEAITRYVTQNLFNFNMISRVITGQKTNAFININTP
jgi:protein involved in polysaccharide export with SLBB domain